MEMTYLQAYLHILQAKYKDILLPLDNLVVCDLKEIVFLIREL